MKRIFCAIYDWLTSCKNQKNTTFEDANKGYKALHIYATPNPQAYQFFVNQLIVDYGSVHYNSADESEKDPFGKAVFDIFGVETIFIKENFVTITKSPVVSWDTIAPRIKIAIETYLTFHETRNEEMISHQEKNGFMEFTPEEFLDFSAEQKEKIIQTIFECAIRPALIKDGGDLQLIGIQGKVIQIRFQGACGTCPSSMQGTLQFIESMIKERLHPNIIVEAK